MKGIKENRYRLNWKGMLLISETLLYADPDTPWILMIPILAFLYLPSLFLSYLKVSSKGIELFYWPTYRLKSNWKDIKRLGYVTLLGKIPYDALYLIDVEPYQSVSRYVGIQKKWTITLDDFRGWPEGKLHRQLKEYLPWINESEK